MPLFSPQIFFPISPFLHQKLSPKIQPFLVTISLAYLYYFSPQNSNIFATIIRRGYLSRSFVKKTRVKISEKYAFIKIKPILLTQTIEAFACSSSAFIDTLNILHA